MQRAGIKTSALSKQRSSEKIMRNAKVFRITNPERKRTENPIITEIALIAIPLPVVFRVSVTASE